MQPALAGPSPFARSPTMMTHPVQTSRHHLPESQLIQGSQLIQIPRSQLLWRMGIPMMKAMMMMMMMMMAIKAMVMLLPV